MLFRPCIDIHNGQVKQIVGGTLLDQADFAQENFVSNQDAAFFASAAGIFSSTTAKHPNSSNNLQSAINFSASAALTSCQH